jgi:hypothetical protein
MDLSAHRNVRNDLRAARSVPASALLARLDLIGI